VDERLAHLTLWRRLFLRPEFGAIVGVIGIFVFFGLVDRQFWAVSTAARYLDLAAPLGIMAVAVALLMIGGEFDLSSGVMTGTTALVTGLLVSEGSFNIWLALAVSLALALAIGFVNGVLVLRTGLPSFIITLGTMFILQGVNVGLTTQVTGTVRVENIDAAGGYELARSVFAESFGSAPENFRIVILWWLLITGIATWVLLRTQIGNWIFAVGGDQDAARSVGVPVTRTKISLFMYVSASAWLVGSASAIRFTSVQSALGRGEEFRYIIAAVVGGCLLTGGYGSAIGATIGALIMGIVFIGIPLVGWAPDWRLTFFGVLLLVAVLVNNFVRRKAQETVR